MGREQPIRQASKMNTHLALRQAGNGPVSSPGEFHPGATHQARSGHSLTVNDYPALDADTGLLDVTCLRSA